MFARKAFVPLAACLLACLTFLLAACTDGQRMRDSLAELERMNSADSLMTNDSLALALCDYFDSHGTPNERMRAHYILGRTYADLGEAPAALDAYLDAVNKADTTATDCDWGRLSRVYGQMSHVYYQQGLMQDYIKHVSSSIDCAWKAKDTLQALNESFMKVIGYDQLQQFDAVISLYDEIYLKYKSLYGEKKAARYCALPLRALLNKGHIGKAYDYLSSYEMESGYFQNSEVEAGREAYYYIKGLYHLYAQQYDSAEHYFRKELQLGQDFANQSMAAHGLSQAYMQLDMQDSAAKYSIYGYEMNDSAYSEKASKDVARVAAQYRYARHQRIALQEHIKAEKKTAENRKLYELLIVIIVAVCYATYIWHKKRKNSALLLQRKVEELAQVKRELQDARQQEDELRCIIHDKEVLAEGTSQEMIFLHSLIAQLNQTIVEKEAREDILNDDIARLQKNQEKMKADIDLHLAQSTWYQNCKKKIKKCNMLSTKEFREIDGMVKNDLPIFHQFINSKKHLLNENQYKLCILFRLHADINQAAALLNVSPSYVSKISRDILQKLFNESGSGLLLKKKLGEINEYLP